VLGSGIITLPQPLKVKALLILFTVHTVTSFTSVPYKILLLIIIITNKLNKTVNDAEVICGREGTITSLRSGRQFFPPDYSGHRINTVDINYIRSNVAEPVLCATGLLAEPYGVRIPTGSTQLPIQWVPGLFLGGKMAGA
jgi:hypothetical protein